MVSGFKLALRKEIVPRPPEKMHSTATADPGYISSENELHRKVKTYLALKGYRELALRV
jgi:hypothetical protein